MIFSRNLTGILFTKEITLFRVLSTVNVQLPTLLLESLRHGRVSRLLLEGLAPWEWRSLFTEPSWNPGVLISVLPEGDSNTPLNVHTRLGNTGVVVGLLLELLRSLRECHTDIQLSDGDVNLKVIGPGAPELLHRG